MGVSNRALVSVGVDTRTCFNLTFWLRLGDSGSACELGGRADAWTTTHTLAHSHTQTYAHGLHSFSGLHAHVTLSVDSGEGITLSYSTDDAHAVWTALRYVEGAPAASVAGTVLTIVLPPAARTSNTAFKWEQVRDDPALSLC